MSTLNDTDLFVIERSGTQYQVRSDEMSTLNDTDLLVVERGGVQYKVEAQYVSTGPTGELEAPVEVLTPLNGAGVGAGTPYNPISTAITTVGAGGSITDETDPINNIEEFGNTWAGTQTGTAPTGQMSNLWNGFSNQNSNNGIGVSNSGDVRFTFTTPVPVTPGSWQFENSGAANYSNVFSWEDDNGVHNMGGGNGVHSSGWGVDAFSPQPVGAIKWIQVGNSPGFGVTNLKIDGANINSEAPQYQAKTILSFPTNNNFDYFDVGDVVPAEFTSEVIDGSAPSNIFGAVDGNEATFSQNIDSNQNTYQWTIPNGVNVTKVEVIVSKTGGTSGNDFYINNCQVTRSFENSLTTSPQLFDVTNYTDTLGNTIGSIFNNFRLLNAQGSAPTLRIHGIILNDEILTAVVKVINKDEDANTITVDGGTWSIGDTLTSETPYEASLICSSATELANMVGPITMTDENGDLVTPQTSGITDISGTAPAITLTFADSTNLEYFSPGDVVDTQKSAAQNVNQSGASIYQSDPKGLPSSFYNDLPTISYEQIRAASVNQWNNVFKPDAAASFTYQMIELEYAVDSIQFTTQGSYIMTACSKDGVTWEQLEQSPASQTAATRTATGGPFKYWYIGFNADTGDNTDNYYLSCNAETYVDVKVISTNLVNNTMTVDGGTWSNGDTASLPPLDASATDVVGVDGNTLQIDGVVGTWLTGLHIKGATITSSAPSPSSIVFTSQNNGTTAVTGTDATLASRVWTLESGPSQTGPWTLVGEYIDSDANASQDGATPWSGKPTLSANTYYQVKVKYTSDNAEPVESVFNTFKTGDA